MRAVILYESMFGNTHAIADAVGNGLEPMLEVVVVPLAEAGRERLGDADLLVAVGPTHFHGMSRTFTRKWACASARKPSNDLVLEVGKALKGRREHVVLASRLVVRTGRVRGSFAPSATRSLCALHPAHRPGADHRSDIEHRDRREIAPHQTTHQDRRPGQREGHDPGR